MEDVAPRARLLRYGPVVTVCAAIFVLSSIPGRAMPAVLWDKASHALAYAVVGAAFAHAWWGVRSWWWAVAAATLYGVSDELHQLFVPGRMGDVRDVLADAIGGLIGAVLYGPTRGIVRA